MFRYLRHILDTFVAPRQCAVCGALLIEAEQYICSRCLLELPVCDRRGTAAVDLGAVIDNAVRPPALVEMWFNYDPRGRYAPLIKDFKYHGTRSSARRYGALFARDLQSRCYAGCGINIDDVEVLLPMPMHWRKELRRGYNQAEEIAQGMADVLGCRVAGNLVAVRPHHTQTRLRRHERLSNLQGCFAIEHAADLAGRHVAIVDDVITTGTSMAEAAITLSHAQPAIASLSILALARTISD